MKFIVILITIALTFFSCRENHVISESHPWPATEVPEADSLIIKLHDAFDNGADDKNIQSLLKQIDELRASHNSDKLLGAATDYWQSRFLTRLGRHQEANEITRKALESLDSTRHTYHFFKLRSELERTEPSVGGRFRIAMENLNYFRSIGDSLSAAHSLVTVGNLLCHIGDLEKASHAFCQARDIWKAAEMHRNYHNNQINIALCLSGDTADRLHRKLIELPSIKADTTAYTLLLRNMASNAANRGDSESALRFSQLGIDLIGQNNKYAANAAVLNAIRSMELAKRNDKENALISARKALELSNSPIEKYATFYILRTAARVYNICNLPDSAWILLNQALEVRSDSEFELNNITLGIEESRQALMQTQFATELKAMKQKQLWLAIVFALIIVILCIAFILTQKIRAQRMKEQMALAELEKSQSQLARETLMFEQNESLIERLKKEIEKERDDAHISQSCASQLLSTLNMHLADRAERRTFLDIHDHMLPGFSAKLKAEYPDLTEHQIKLAAYISAGMSNTLIAKLLNITPASVRTLRYRMRSKFALEHNQSLEEFLRRFAT